MFSQYGYESDGEFKEEADFNPWAHYDNDCTVTIRNSPTLKSPNHENMTSTARINKDGEDEYNIEEMLSPEKVSTVLFVK